MPVREDPDQGFCEPVPDAPHTATFWTVYGHLREGGAEDLIDFYDEASAEAAASILEQALTASALRAATDELHAALRASGTAIEPAR